MQRIIYIFLILLIFQSQFLFSQETEIDSLDADAPIADSLETRLDSLRYTADTIVNDYKAETINLLNSAAIFYKNSYIKSDTIEIDISKEIASSRGLTEMYDGNQLIYGKKLIFDIGTKEGILSAGRTRFQDGYYSGRVMRKVGEKTFDIDKAKYTTCNIAKHYYIYSPKFRIFLNDKIVAKPVILFINHFPVLALPFATFPINRNRESGFLVPQPGYNNSDGKFLRNFAYFKTFGQYGDALLSMDFLERTGVQMRLRGRYKKRYVLDGNFNGRFLYQFKDEEGNYKLRWSLDSYHKQTLSPYSHLTIKSDFISDADFRETSDDNQIRMEQSLHSYIYYNFNQDITNFNSAIDFRRELDDNEDSYLGKFSYSTSGDFYRFSISSRADVDTYPEQENKTTLTLPSLTFNMYRRNLAQLFGYENQVDSKNLLKKFNFSYNGDAVHYGLVRGNNPTLAEIVYKDTYDSTGAFLSEHREGVKHNITLSYIDDLFRYFNLNQSFNYHEIWQDRDKNNNKFVRGYSYNSSTRLKTSLYGLFNINSFGLLALRHILTPSVVYSMNPDFSRNDRFYSFSGISISSGSRSQKLNFSLSNKLQAKITGADEKIKKLNNLLGINSSFNYDFEREGKGFSDITHSLDVMDFEFKLVKPEAKLSNSFRCTQDFYTLDLKNYSLSARFSLNGNMDYIDYYPYDSPQKLDELVYAKDSNFISSDPDVKAKPWNLSMSYSYNKNLESGSYSSNLHGNAMFNITKNWSITYSNYYNFKENELISQSVHLKRDLHCWQLDFSWNKSGDYWSYTFKVFVKKLPDLKFRHSDHKAWE
ncbi:MAG: LPS-assembly protein LptD [Candidatus Cloacimonetes bacterium]|nr:LPS-assembly protein LptD [Candidatus Cloacimonadota bacterium]